MFYRDHQRLTLDCGNIEMTKQSFKDECDIHRILKQFQKTGIYSHVNSQSPQYGDLPDAIDYQQSLHTLMHAQDVFASLPSTVRNHFANDPMQFLAAFQDPSQDEKLREFGLIAQLPDTRTAELSANHTSASTSPQVAGSEGAPKAP